MIKFKNSQEFKEAYPVLCSSGFRFSMKQSFLATITDNLSDEEIERMYKEEQSIQSKIQAQRAALSRKRKRERTKEARLEKERREKLLLGAIQISSTQDVVDGTIKVDDDSLQRLSSVEILKHNDEAAKLAVIEAKNDVIALLRMKAKQLMSDKDELKKQSLQQLASAFSILFDKSQLVKGEATKHVAVHSKISSDMTPDEMMATLLKRREAQVDSWS